MKPHSPLLTLREPQILADPYPYYARLRDETPIFRDPSGAWVVSRYSDVFEILMSEDASSQRLQRDRQLRSDEDREIREMYEQLAMQVLFLDAPQHGRLRGLVSKAFTPKFVQRMRPTIEHIVDSLLAGPLASGQLDVIRELAIPLPMRVC